MKLAKGIAGMMAVALGSGNQFRQLSVTAQPLLIRDISDEL